MSPSNSAGASRDLAAFTGSKLRPTVWCSRSVLYHGIASSRWGPITAILVSAVFWAALHIQYDAYGIITIALMGLYLGAARFKTGSLPLLILLHAFNNAAGLAEAAFFAQRAT